MKLDETHKQKISAWIAEGAKLSDIQKRIGSELGLTMTYMETRMLVDDLKLVPSDPIRPKEDKLPALTPPTTPQGTPPAGEAPIAPLAPEAIPAAGNAVSVNVDAIARPGTLVSGTVTFSDGQKAVWYMDQQGRLGVAPDQKGYKPAAADVEAFQRKLEVELTRVGY